MTIYKLTDPITGKTEYLEISEEEAKAKLNEIKDYLMARESHRFSMNRSIVIGTDTMWRAVDKENDPPVGNYFVFDMSLGTHEPFMSLAEAIAKHDGYIAKFIEERQLDTLVVVDRIPDPKAQPKSTGLNTI
jgi:hypothetical protein